jgi:hypothetical protein
MGNRPTRCKPAAVTTKPGRLVSGIHQRFGFGRKANPILHLEYVNI